VTEQHIQVQRDTHQVVAIGYFPTPPDDDNIAVVVIEEHHRPALAEVGAKYLEDDGTISVVTGVE